MDSNEPKQRGYARYLLKLEPMRRDAMLQRMKPALRQKMLCFLDEEWAVIVASLEKDGRELYLRTLKNTQPERYQRLLPLLTARLAADRPQYLRAVWQKLTATAQEARP